MRKIKIIFRIRTADIIILVAAEKFPADEEVKSEQQQTGCTYHHALSEVRRSVSENDAVFAGIGSDSHEAVGNPLDIGFFAVDLSRPALAVRNAEEYELRLIEVYLSLEAL